MAELRLFAVLLVAFVATVECNCPNGWVTHGTKCYFFSHDTEDWPGALTMCKLMDGELVQIENGTEGSYLSNQVKANALSYWIGLTDVQEEGAWRWVYSNSLLGGISGYHPWDKGQPNNSHQNQNCAYIIGSNGHWADSECHNALHYICERDSLGGGEIIG